MNNPNDIILRLNESCDPCLQQIFDVSQGYYWKFISELVVRQVRLSVGSIVWDQIIGDLKW